MTFEVGRGEVVAVLGPNGSGKTTLLRILMTLLVPTGGVARVAGADVVAEAPAVRRSVGVVFQSPSVDGRLTARENLRHHGRLHGLRGRALEERIADRLAAVDLADRADDLAGRLSGGQVRRLEIAKALLHDPEVLLLDEASTGLDPRARRSLWDLVDAARARGVATLAATHMADEADRADRVVLLDEGAVVAAGAPADLKRGIRHEPTLEDVFLEKTGRRIVE